MIKIRVVLTTHALESEDFLPPGTLLLNGQCFASDVILGSGRRRTSGSLWTELNPGWEAMTQESQDPQVPTQGGTEKGPGGGSHGVHRPEGTLGAQVIMGGLWVCRRQGILETGDPPVIFTHSPSSRSHFMT